MNAKTVWSVALVAAAWLAATWMFWVGYAGHDDVVYARYAWLLHRPPVNWWEFRIPAIMALRASFKLLGPTEFAAAVPSLLASLAVLGSVAWFVEWPRKLTWQNQLSMLLAATMPLDVGFRSVAYAPMVAVGFLSVGTVCFLKGRRLIQYVGAFLMALGFETHEVSMFYVGILCITATALDRQRYLKPMLACVAISALAIAAEAVAYTALLGNPLARYTTAAATTVNLGLGFDHDAGVYGVRWYTFPLELLVVAKPFGFDLGLLLVTGLCCWQHFDRQQRILYITTFLTWAWLGYGSQVPWSYRPIYRAAHYYFAMELGAAALLPAALGYAIARRPRVAASAALLAVAVHLGLLAAGGRWGQVVVVARELLEYARQRPSQVFVTDVVTMYYMYALGGFRLPDNVVCINGPAVENFLQVNRESPGTPPYTFPERPISGILVNLELMEWTNGVFEEEFAGVLKGHDGPRQRIAPIRYKALFAPLRKILGPRRFMIKNAGGELIEVSPAWEPGAGE